MSHVSKINAELEGKSERYAHAATTGFSGPIEPFGRWVGCGPRHPPGSLPPWTTWHAFSCSPTASAAIQGAAAVQDSVSYSGRRCSEPSWPPSLPLVPTHTGACHPSGLQPAPQSATAGSNCTAFSAWASQRWGRHLSKVSSARCVGLGGIPGIADMPH